MLASELACTRALLETLRREYQALTQGDADQIEEAASAKQAQMQRLQQLLRERERLLGSQGLSPDSEGMEHLLQSLDAPRLDTDWRELRRLATQLKEQNEVNGAIVALGQRQVQQALDLLTGRGGSDTYGPAGNHSAPQASHSLARA